VIDDALADKVDDRLSPACRAMLVLLAKVTRAVTVEGQRALSADDVRPVLAAGATPTAVIEALNVGYLFNTITRLADSFEFHVGPPAAFSSAAKRLLSHGYK